MQIAFLVFIALTAGFGLGTAYGHKVASNLVLRAQNAEAAAKQEIGILEAKLKAVPTSIDDLVADALKKAQASTVATVESVKV